MRGTSQPGAAFFTVAAYYLLKALGLDVDLYFVHGIIVPVGAAFAVFTAYLFGRELRDERTGALSAVLISLSWAYMYRTNYGAKHEGLAIPFMLLGFYLFLVAYRRRSLLLSALAGLSLGMVVLSWGAYLYPWNFMALLSLVWLLLNPGDRVLAKVYLVSNALTTAFVATTPRFGPNTAFLSLVGFLPLVTTVFSLFLLLGLPRVMAMSPAQTRKLGLAVLGALALLLAAATVTGITSLISGRILAVVLPTLREPGVTTVAEHAVPSWNQLFDDFQSSVVFALFALYLYTRRMRSDFKAAFAALYFATSLYFSSSIARLILLLSPAIALTASLGLVELFDRLLELPRPATHRKRAGGGVHPAVVGLALIVLLLLFSPSILGSKVPLYSHQPALILTSSIPLLDYNYQYTDWISALEWIKLNVPRDATIATWWDYGYWVSVNTGRKTTADNATIDTRQIQEIARAFMSDEDTALRIFRGLNVTYVVVFEPLQYLTLSNGLNVYFSVIHPALGGDVAKSPQMLKWIGLSASNYIYGYSNGSYAYLDLSGQRVGLLLPAPTPEGLNATLYRMIYTPNFKQQVFIFDPFLGQLAGYYGPSYHMPPLKNFELVYVSEPNGWVKIFKVKS